MESHELGPRGEPDLQQPEPEVRGFFTERVTEVVKPAVRRPSRRQMALIVGGVSGRLRYLIAAAIVIAVTSVSALLLTDSSNVTELETTPASPQAGNASKVPIASTAGEMSTAVPMQWHGAVLPTSQAGPATVTVNRARTFSRTPLSAALAAVHISVRMDPLTGPSVFRPTVRQQTRGNRETWLARLNEIYRDVAKSQGLRNGAPAFSATGFVAGWRIADTRADFLDPTLRRVSVDLLVVKPDGDEKVFRIPLKWSRGDWAVALPDPAKSQLFRTQTRSKVTNFTPFYEWQRDRQ